MTTLHNIVYYCRDCDRADQSSLPSLKCANCKKEMKSVGWAESRMKEDESDGKTEGQQE